MHRRSSARVFSFSGWALGPRADLDILAVPSTPGDPIHDMPPPPAIALALRCPCRRQAMTGARRRLKAAAAAAGRRLSSSSGSGPGLPGGPVRGRGRGRGGTGWNPAAAAGGGMAAALGLAAGGRLLYGRLAEEGGGGRAPGSGGGGRLAGPRRDASRVAIALGAGAGAGAGAGQAALSSSASPSPSGPRIVVEVDAGELAEFLEGQRTAVASARERCRGEAAEVLRSELATALAGPRERVPAFASWYLSYGTAYRLLGRAAAAAAGHGAASLSRGREGPGLLRRRYPTPWRPTCAITSPSGTGPWCCGRP